MCAFSPSSLSAASNRETHPNPQLVLLASAPLITLIRPLDCDCQRTFHVVQAKSRRRAIAVRVACTTVNWLLPLKFGLPLFHVSLQAFLRILAREQELLQLSLDAEGLAKSDF